MRKTMERIMEKPQETSQGYDFDVSREAGDLYMEHRDAEEVKKMAEIAVGNLVATAAAGVGSKRTYKEGRKAQRELEHAERRAEEAIEAGADHFKANSEAYKQNARIEAPFQAPDPWESAEEAEAEQRIAEDPWE